MIVTMPGAMDLRADYINDVLKLSNLYQNLYQNLRHNLNADLRYSMAAVPLGCQTC